MTTARWNVLVYAVAANQTELDRVDQAIKDMQAALPANACNVVVQVHARSKTERTWITGGVLRKEPLPMQDSSDWATLKRFLNAANQNFSKRSNSSQASNMTALILWAHSTGFNDVALRPRKAAGLPGLDQLFTARAGAAHDASADVDVDVEERASHEPEHVPHHPGHYGCSWGPDPNTQRSLNVIGVKNAIAASTRHRVEVLGLNACGMAFLEVVYELRGVADIQVASQVEAKPWPYGAIVQVLAATPELTAEQLAIAIVDTVRSEIATGRPDAISALQSGQAVHDLAMTLDAYAKRVSELIDEDWPSVSKAVMKDAWRVDDPYMVDLMSLLDVIGKHHVEVKTASNAVAARFRAMFLAEAANKGHGQLRGLSIFCPKTTYRDIVDVYKGLEFRNRSWRNFLLKFQRRLPPKR